MGKRSVSCSGLTASKASSPIDMFSTRRVRWIFQRVLRPEGVYTVVHAVPPFWYNSDDWWRHHVGRTDFRSECSN